MNPIDERRGSFNDRQQFHVWVDFWHKDRLTLAIIDGRFPPSLTEEEVRWLIEVLQRAVATNDA